MSSNPVKTTLYNATTHAHLIPTITEIHIASTLDDGRTLADFRPPFTPTKRTTIERWWADRLTRTHGPDHTDEVILAFCPDENGQEALAGYVQLHMPVDECGPFRAYVQKLFVSPDFRRRGVARALMARLEDVAMERGRWNLVRSPCCALGRAVADTAAQCLSTAKQSPARGIYPKFGYIEVCTPCSPEIKWMIGKTKLYEQYGTIPNWAIHADGETLMDEICFYKDLRKR